MRFKKGQLVKFKHPPREEFTDVMAEIVDADYDDEVLRVTILAEYVEHDPRLAKRRVYRFEMQRFVICKRLTESEWILLQELKAKDNRTPVEEYLLFGLESV